MAEGYFLEPATMENVASKLRGAATTLSETRFDRSAPDAGDLSELMGGVLAKLAGDTSELITGTGAAGDQVDKAKQTYLEQETSAGADIRVG